MKKLNLLMMFLKGCSASVDVLATAPKLLFSLPFVAFFHPGVIGVLLGLDTLRLHPDNPKPIILMEVLE